MARAAERLVSGSRSTFRRRIREVGRFLADQRPTMAPVRNGLNQLIAAAMATPSPRHARLAVRKAAQAFAADLERARRHLGERGVRALRRDGAVLTHCYSTTVVRTLARLPNRRRLRVFVTETRPSRQGLRTCRELRSVGIRPVLIVDSAVAHVLSTRRVDRVLLGADAVDAGGRLYNRIGTRTVVTVARAHGVPVWVLAESQKFSPTVRTRVPLESRRAEEVVGRRALRGVRILNPAYDSTPAALVSRYITDRRDLRPGQVESFVRRLPWAGRTWV